MINKDECQNLNTEIISVQNEAFRNPYFRKEIWTGEYAQATVMSVARGGEVGMEIHENQDQIFFVVQGIATVYAGRTKQGVRLIGNAMPGSMVAVPSGTWHNLVNDRNCPLKLISVYAPPAHEPDTLHKTKFDSDLDEH